MCSIWPGSTTFAAPRASLSAAWRRTSCPPFICWTGCADRAGQPDSRGRLRSRSSARRRLPSAASLQFEQRNAGPLRSSSWTHVRAAGMCRQTLQSDRSGIFGRAVRADRAKNHAHGDGGGPDPLRLSTLHETRDFLDVRDAVRAYSAILSRGESGKTYFVGSGRSRTLGEMIRLFEARSAGRSRWQLKTVRLPPHRNKGRPRRLRSSAGRRR